MARDTPGAPDKTRLLGFFAGRLVYDMLFFRQNLEEPPVGKPTISTISTPKFTVNEGKKVKSTAALSHLPIPNFTRSSSRDSHKFLSSALSLEQHYGK